jgi:hypothetical protein
VERKFNLVERVGYRFLDWLAYKLERYSERQWAKMEARKLYDGPGTKAWADRQGS